MRLSVGFIPVVLLLWVSPVFAEPKLVCYADGPYLTHGDGARITRDKLRSAANSAVTKLNHAFELQTSWNCAGNNENRDTIGLLDTTCFQDSPCSESMYVLLKEEANAYSYTIVTLHRGKHLNMTGVVEDELLASLENDIVMVLSRPRDYSFGELESKLKKERLLDTQDLQQETSLPTGDSTQKIRLIKGFALGTAVFALASAATAIVTGVAATNKIDDLDHREPENIEKSEIDGAKNLYLASRVTLGAALAGGVTSAILWGVWFKMRKSSQTSGHETSSVSFMAGPVLFNQGGLFMLRGQF